MPNKAKINACRFLGLIDTAVQLPKLHVQGDQDPALNERVLAALKLTGDADNAFAWNEHLRGFASKCGCSLKKPTEQLLGTNAGMREGRGSMLGKSKYDTALHGLRWLRPQPLGQESA